MRNKHELYINQLEEGRSELERKNKCLICIVSGILFRLRGPLDIGPISMEICTPSVGIYTFEKYILVLGVHLYRRYKPMS
jgi:hypothetical protein